MGQELTQVLCPDCGASGEADPGLTRWQCGKCGSGFFLRRCSACARVSYVDGLQGFHLPWPCTWCGRFNAGFSQNQDPAAASAAELAAELTRYGPPGGTTGPGAGDRADPAPAPAAGGGPPAAWHRQGRDPAAARAGHPGTGQPLPVAPAEPLRRARRRASFIGLSVALAAAGVAATAALLTAGDPGATGMAAAQVSTTRAIQFTASHARRIDFQGVTGRLVIVGTGPGKVIMTGQLHGDGGTPALQTRFDRASGTLTVSVRCPPAAQCTQDLRLAVPPDTGTAVRQPGGRVVVTDLDAPLRITATNVDISASGLRSADLAAVVTSGHLSAAFATPPRQVSISLDSAQATLRLPGRVAYRVTREVMSGHLRGAIRQAGNATHIVNARIDSGELELLPS
jgi:ribosomal protein S27AE